MDDYKNIRYYRNGLFGIFASLYMINPGNPFVDNYTKTVIIDLARLLTGQTVLGTTYVGLYNRFRILH